MASRSPAGARSLAPPGAREGPTPFLVERLRIGLRLVLASILLFAALDLHLQREHLAALWSLKLLGIGIVVAALGVLRHPPAQRWARHLALPAVAAIYVSTATAGIIAGDDTTAPILLVVSAMATGTLLPWGARAQLASALIAGAALLVNVVAVSGGLDPVLGYQGSAVAVALAVSVYVACELDRTHRERARVAALLAGQSRVLEMVATGAPLDRVLDALSRTVEVQSRGLLCSVLILEGDRLRHGAGPSLPEDYNRAVDGLTIGPRVGSCGTAAYLRRPVVVRDIATDPLWDAFRDLALAHGLRACWSAPIIAGDERCLGTFAMYYREPRSPGRRDWHAIEIATHLARVAIERRGTEEALARSRRQLEEESQLNGALARMGQEMIASLSTPQILERLCRLTTELLACDGSDTILRAPDGDAFVPHSAHGYSAEEWEALRLLRIPRRVIQPLLASLGADRVVQVEARHVRDPLHARLLREYGITVALYVPLRRGAETIGLLSAAQRGRTGRFTALQERIARGIAQLASIALENARLVEELRRASQLKTEFVSTMSHELRTPLSVIIGYTDMLHDESPRDVRHETLDKIKRSSLELLEMIEATLNLNRLEAGKDPAHLETVDVPALFDELASEFAALGVTPEVVLRWEVAGDVPLHTDRRKLKIILKNLVGNALKFTPAGEVEVRCAEAGGACAFVVRDTGVGIKPEHLPLIFDMFRQGDSSDARSYGGVGLGLYIARRLATQLGGELTVESAVGRGTIFTMRLACAAADAALGAS